jgi:hydrogenase maturation protease
MKGRQKQMRILIAGVGNIFFGDDAFGVEVARRLRQQQFSDCVSVVDFGIRGLDLAYALLDGNDLTIVVDAVPRGGKPGTLYVIEPALDVLAASEDSGPVIETHALDPVRVLRLALALGAEIKRLVVVGCEPATDQNMEEMQDGLSPHVLAAVEDACVLIPTLVQRFLRGESIASSQVEILSGKEIEG